MKMTRNRKTLDHYACNKKRRRNDFASLSISKSGYLFTSFALLLLLNLTAAATTGAKNDPDNLVNEADIESSFSNDSNLEARAESRNSEDTLTSPEVTSRPKITVSQHSGPNPQGASREQEPRQTLGSLIFVAIVASICIVAFVAFVGGAYCWYRHASFMSATRRVFYRSSDASVLIHNDYQQMGGRTHQDFAGNGHVAEGNTNSNMARLAEKTDYPAYGVTGPNPLHYSPNGPPIDRNLNRSAEVYHYQQQKQKLKALSSASSEVSARSGQGTSDTLNDFSTETREDDEENSDGEYTVYECPGLASTTDGPMEIHNPLFADSEESFASYRTSPGNNMTSSKYNYSATISNQG